MTESSFQRARRPEQKQQRRAAILAAAEQLLAEDGVDGVSLNAIARRAGLAKSNVYRYFESREQIFLWILLDDMVAWACEVERGLEPLAGRNSASAAARVIAAAFLGRQRLCELNSVLSWVLEQNVSEETVLDFKTRASVGAMGVADALHRALPSIPEDRCLWTLRSVFAFVAGLWPLTRMSPEVERVLSRPELCHLTPNFEEDLSRSVRALLYGLLVEGWRSSGHRVDRE